MELILKKTKLTSSIINQILRANELALKTYSVVGWCIHQKIKWVILYDENTKDLKKYLIPVDVKIEGLTGSSTLPHEVYLKVDFGSKYTPLHYRYPTEEEAKEFMGHIRKIKRLAETVGQFFI